MLKPDPTTTNYIFILVGSEFSSSWGCRGRELGGMFNIYTTYYCTMLQQLLLHCYLYCFLLNCWLILPSCCKTRRKMLVFDRPSIFPLTLVLLSCSPLYSLPLHFDTNTYCLECLGLSLAEYARYSPLLYFPLCFLYTLPVAAIRRWSLKV